MFARTGVTAPSSPPKQNLGQSPAVRLRVVGLQVQGAPVRVGAGSRLGGHARQPQDLAELLLDGGGDVRMVLEILLGVFASLANAVLLVRIPGAAFVHEALSLARSRRSPSREMPTPYIMSNSAWRNGGATLFFTTLARMRLPTPRPPL